MTAVDTNVIVRLLTADDARQFAAASALFESEPIWIAKTVLLETAWVLGSNYGYDDRTVAAAFAKLVGLANVKVEDPACVASALALIDSGIEFADALHLCSRPAKAAFGTFDRAFARRATKAGAAAVLPLR